MTEPTEIAIWLAVNETGDFIVSNDGPSGAISEISEAYGFEAVRVVRIEVVIDLPVPEIVNIAVTVPPDAKAPVQVVTIT